MMWAAESCIMFQNVVRRYTENLRNHTLIKATEDPESKTRSYLSSLEDP